MSSEMFSCPSILASAVESRVDIVRKLNQSLISEQSTVFTKVVISLESGVNSSSW